MSYRISVDIGGTFTDLAYVGDGLPPRCQISLVDQYLSRLTVQGGAGQGRV